MLIFLLSIHTNLFYDTLILFCFKSFWAWHGKVRPRYSSKGWVNDNFTFAIKQASLYPVYDFRFQSFRYPCSYRAQHSMWLFKLYVILVAREKQFSLTGLNIPVGSVSPPDSWRNSLPSSFRTHIIAVQVIKFHHTLSRWIKLPWRAAPGRAQWGKGTLWALQCCL